MSKIFSDICPRALSPQSKMSKPTPPMTSPTKKQNAEQVFFSAELMTCWVSGFEHLCTTIRIGS